MRYRILKKGETIKFGDENKKQFGQKGWEPVGSLIGRKVGVCGSFTGIPFEIRRPLKTKVVDKTSTNISYTAALRKRVGEYFPGQSSQSINNFIKSVQRLNASRAKHCA